MKVRESKIERNTPIEELPKDKVRITCQGEDPERIWVAKDEENKVMYLLNDALMFYPMPSWGMELPLQDEIDLYKYRGDKFEDTDITVCKEAYDVLKSYIGEEYEFNCAAWIES